MMKLYIVIYDEIGNHIFQVNWEIKNVHTFSLTTHLFINYMLIWNDVDCICCEINTTFKMLYVLLSQKWIVSKNSFKYHGVESITFNLYV